MKYSYVLFLLFSIYGCNDGDLQIAAVDFDSATLDFCDSPATTATTLFFKINAENALILELQSGVLLNEETADSLVSSIPSQSTVRYRIFTDNVDRNYFCDALPPTEPEVLEEIPAEAGEVIIRTVQSVADTTAYEHTLSISNLTLINANGERLTNLNTVELGTVITTKE